MRTKILLIYCAFIFFLLSGTLFVADYLVLPLFISAPSRDTFLMGFCATPGTMVDDTAINSMGFTGDCISLNKPPKTIRILTLGGSAFFNRRMTERLKNNLDKASGRHIEILGGALRVHNTMSSLIKYRSLSKYNFDYVLIYHNINDLDANHVATKDFASDYSHLSPWFKRNVLLDHSVILRFIYNTYVHRPVYFKPMGSLFASERSFRRNIVLLIDAIRQDGAIPILMTFAWSIPDHYTIEAFRSHSVGYNNPTGYDRCPVEMWGSPEYVREGLLKHNAVLRKVAEKKNILLIDQEDLIGKDLFWFGDICHFSEEGTEQFIQNIVKFFIEQELLQ